MTRMTSMELDVTDAEGRLLTLEFAERLGPDSRSHFGGPYLLVRSIWEQAFSLQRETTSGLDAWLSSLSRCCESTIRHSTQNFGWCMTCRKRVPDGFEVPLNGASLVEIISIYLPFDPLTAALVASSLVDACHTILQTPSSREL